MRNDTKAKHRLDRERLKNIYSFIFILTYKKGLLIGLDEGGSLEIVLHDKIMRQNDILQKMTCYRKSNTHNSAWLENMVQRLTYARKHIFLLSTNPTNPRLQRLPLVTVHQHFQTFLFCLWFTGFSFLKKGSVLAFSLYFHSKKRYSLGLTAVAD